MAYSGKTMQSEEARYPVPSARFFLLMLGMGGLIGLVLLLLDAPFWLFYVAPMLMAPILVLELRSLAVAQPRVKAGGKGNGPEGSPLAGLVGRQSEGRLRPLAGAVGRLSGMPWIVVGLMLIAAVLLAHKTPITFAPLRWANVVAAIVISLVALFRLILGALPDYLRALREWREGAPTSPATSRMSYSRVRLEDLQTRDKAVTAKEIELAVEKAEGLEAARTEARVEPSGTGQWTVRFSDEKGPEVDTFSTRIEALEAAHKRLLLTGGGELLSIGGERHAERIRILVASGESQEAFWARLKRIERKESTD